jgi:hypothetical protein
MKEESRLYTEEISVVFTEDDEYVRDMNKRIGCGTVSGDAASVWAGGYSRRSLWCGSLL